MKKIRRILLPVLIGAACAQLTVMSISTASSEEKIMKQWKADNQIDTQLSVDEVRARLTPEQFNVTQHEATERPFQNPYWDNHEPGIYVDIVSGEPLFSSLDKFDSGTGWPSFTKPIESSAVTSKVDRKLFASRTEVRSKLADSHLGHVFDDGPAPTGQRFCINSASLKFIPVSELEKSGYGAYRPLLEKE